MKELSIDREMSGGHGHDEGDVVLGSRLSVFIDHERDRYPYCVVWTPLPGLTFLLPFIGHVGICSSEGEVHDFAGPYCVTIDEMAFGRPYKYVPLDLSCMPPGLTARDYDNAVASADRRYAQRMHNLLISNCHHHVCDVLNAVEYKGVRNWGFFRLLWELSFNSRFVSKEAGAWTYGPFIAVVLLAAIMMMTLGFGARA